MTALWVGLFAVLLNMKHLFVYLGPPLAIACVRQYEARVRQQRQGGGARDGKGFQRKSQSSDAQTGSARKSVLLVLYPR